MLPFRTVIDEVATPLSFRNKSCVTESVAASTSTLPLPAARPIRIRRTLPSGGAKSCAVPPFSMTASNAVPLPTFGTPSDQLAAVFQLPVPSVQNVCPNAFFDIGDKRTIATAQEIAAADRFAS